MSIRVRLVEGKLIACCAARSVPKDGDLYLDDGVHHALAAKFAADWELPWRYEDADALREREESSNPNRDDWDATFGAGRQ